MECAIITTSCLIHYNKTLANKIKNEFKQNVEILCMKDLLERLQAKNFGEEVRNGNGFIIQIAENYYVVTCHHNISDYCENITVRISGRTELRTTIVGMIPHLDIAVLKIDNCFPFVPTKEISRQCLTLYNYDRDEYVHYDINESHIENIGSVVNGSALKFPHYEIKLQEQPDDYHGLSGSLMRNENGEEIGIVVSYSPKDKYIQVLPYDILMFYVNKIINKQKIFIVPPLSYNACYTCRDDKDPTDFTYGYKLSKDWLGLSEGKVIYQMNGKKFNKNRSMTVFLKNTYEVSLDVCIMLSEEERIMVNYLDEGGEKIMEINPITYDPSSVDKKCLCYNGYVFSILPLVLYNVYHCDDMTQRYIEVFGGKKKNKIVFQLDVNSDNEFTSVLQNLKDQIDNDIGNISIISRSTTGRTQKQLLRDILCL